MKTGLRAVTAVVAFGYLSLAGMLAAAGQGPGQTERFCHACFSGDYPTPIPEELVQLRHAAPLAGAHA